MYDLNTLCYLNEQTSFQEDYKTEFGYEVFDKGNRMYLIFEAVLQSFGVRNRNGREYDAKNIMDKIENDEYINDQLKKNCWMGEIDHPSAQCQGSELTMQRIANPCIEKTSHYIRRPKLNGNLLEAKIQTDSSTDAGMNMAIKIVDGKIVPCFSARVLGALENRNGRPVVNVRKLITYDWVLYPSHREAEARINQPLQESAASFGTELNGRLIYFPQLAQMAAKSSKETEMLCESFGLDISDVTGVTNTGNSIVIQENKNIYIQPLTSSNLRKNTRSLLTDWLNS